jgi:hypothetical protein
MGKHRWFVLAAGLALALPTVAACATPTGSTNAQPSDSASAPATSGTTPAPNPTTTPAEENPSTVLDPPLPGTAKTLRGTPAEGVEAGCLLLQADDGNAYLLLGGDRQLIMSGSRIEVEAVIQPDLMTTCQQGIPAIVKTVRKI